MGDDTARAHDEHGEAFAGPGEFASSGPTASRVAGSSHPGQQVGDLSPEDARPPERVGRFDIECEIGRGGMGIVYRGHDPRLGRLVAIKALSRAFSDPDTLARFDREAKLLARLNHANIATIHAIEEVAGRPYLILEYVAGESLGDRLRHGRLPPATAFQLCGQVAAALEAAHAAGVVHRDLKPDNIRLTREGLVKVLDFGLAKNLSNELEEPRERSGLTEEGAILGTPSYMSPEQAVGDEVDLRSDIWSFGCVLFECLSGQQLWGGGSRLARIRAIISEEPAWHLLPAGLPHRVPDLLRRCLDKDRRRRLQDVAVARLDLAEALDEIEPQEDSPWVPDSTPPALLLALNQYIGGLLLGAAAPQRWSPPIRSPLPLRTRMPPAPAGAERVRLRAAEEPGRAEAPAQVRPEGKPRAGQPPVIARRPGPAAAKKAAPATPIRAARAQTGKAAARPGASRRVLLAAVGAVFLGATCAWWLASRQLALDEVERDAVDVATNLRRARNHAEVRSRVRQMDQHLRQTIEGQLVPSREEWQEAGDFYRALPASVPAVQAALALVRGGLLLLDGALPDADAELRRAQGLGDEVFAGYMLGIVLLRDRRPDEAWVQFSLILERHVDWPPALLGRALCDLGTGNQEAGFRGLRDTMALWEKRAGLVTIYAKCLEEVMDDPDGAFIWYEKAIALGSAEQDLVHRYGALGIQLGHAAQLRVTLASLVEAQPSRPDLWLQAARVERALGAPEAAESLLLEALANDREHVESLLELADLYVRALRHEEAMQLAAAAVAKVPTDPRGHEVLGEALLGLRRKDEASAELILGCLGGLRSSCTLACELGNASSCDRPRSGRVEVLRSSHAGQDAIAGIMRPIHVDVPAAQPAPAPQGVPSPTPTRGTAASEFETLVSRFYELVPRR